MNDRAPQAVPAQASESKGTNLFRELFASNLWMSGLAILKYIPRSFLVKQVDGMAFFTDAKHDEFRNRVLRITAASPRQWGTMSVSQMLHHLNLACGSGLGFYTLPDESSVPVDFGGLVPGAASGSAPTEGFQDTPRRRVRLQL